jgi:CMP-N,N'-diacetyllegionaminic acid synthase
MSILGVIPARGGSKGIPRKNLAEMYGRTLLEWTCRACAGSRELSRLVVSTDDGDIADIAARLGVDVVSRPAELAGDEVPMLPVVEHALTAAGGADLVALLQPTSPLRRAEHIDEAIDALRGSDADTVVSVVPVPHNLVPSSLLRLVDGKLVPLQEEAPLRRQDKERLFARNGPAVLVTRAEVIRGGALYGGDTRPYVMSPEDSIDVDTPFDLELAAFLLSRRETS